MYVEHEAVLLVRVARLVLDAHAAVGWTGVASQHLAHDLVDIVHFRQVVYREVLEQCCAGRDNRWNAAARPDMGGVVESFGEEPESVDRSADSVALLGDEKPAGRVVGSPLLERVDSLPALRNTADVHDLLDQGCRDWNVAVDVRWLRSVLGDELDDVVKGPELSFGGRAENDKVLRRMEDGMETVTSS